jgi:hypothetical protein
MTKKVTPQQEKASTNLVIAGGLLGVGLILIGLLLAGTTNIGAGPQPTVVPAPVFASGALLAPDTTVFITEETPFSILAAADQQSLSQTVLPCTEVEVARSPQDNNYFYLENDGTYWVYATLQEQGWNGWLPFAAISDTLPGACEEG